MDKRRLRRPDRPYYGLYVRLDNPADIAALDKISASLRFPPNRELIHVLVANYLKHNKPEMMA